MTLVVEVSPRVGTGGTEVVIVAPTRVSTGTVRTAVLDPSISVSVTDPAGSIV